MARWHDSPDAPLVLVRWYVTTLPPLKGITLINSRDFDSEKWVDRPIGEVPPTKINRPYNGHWSLPPGLTGQHICNHSYFATGQPWPYTGNPVVYDDEWIPECCDRAAEGMQGGFEFGGEWGDVFYAPDATEGGFEFGGEWGDVIVDTDATEGGFEFGGEWGDVWGWVDATEGGFEFGGEWGDDYTPGTTIPGTSCATAAVALNNHTYSDSVTNPNERWWKFSVTGPALFNVGFVAVSSVEDYSVYFGPDCSSLTFVTSGSGTSNAGVFIPVADFIWAKVTVASGTASYTITLT